MRGIWDPERFWAKVKKSPTCWTWTGSLDPQGYGRIAVKNLGFTSPQLAHRVSWYLATGEFPPASIYVLHRCDNPPCIRPDHLFLGSAADNTADMVAEGRSKAGAQPWESRTHGTRNSQAKLTEEQVVEMRKRAEAGEHFRDLAVAYGTSTTNANRIILGASWRHVWPYGKEDLPTREVKPRKKRSTRS